MVKKPIRKDGSSLENVSALITSPCNKNRFHSTCNKLDRLRRRGYLYCIVILRLNSIVLVLFIDRYRLIERYQTLVPNRLTRYSNVGLNSFSLFLTFANKSSVQIQLGFSKNIRKIWYSWDLNLSSNPFFSSQTWIIIMNLVIFLISVYLLIPILPCLQIQHFWVWKPDVLGSSIFYVKFAPGLNFSVREN